MEMRQRPPALMSDAPLQTPASSASPGGGGLGIDGVIEEDPQSPKSGWDDDESVKDELGQHRRKESVIGSIKENLSLSGKRRTTSQSGSDVRSVGSAPTRPASWPSGISVASGMCPVNHSLGSRTSSTKAPSARSSAA